MGLHAVMVIRTTVFCGLQSFETNCQIMGINIVLKRWLNC